MIGNLNKVLYKNKLFLTVSENSQKVSKKVLLLSCRSSLMCPELSIGFSQIYSMSFSFPIFIHGKETSTLMSSYQHVIGISLWLLSVDGIKPKYLSYLTVSHILRNPTSSRFFMVHLRPWSFVGLVNLSSYTFLLSILPHPPNLSIQGYQKSCNFQFSLLAFIS